MPDQFPRLKNLRLIRGLPVNEYVKLIQRCPSLVTLFCNSQDLELSNDQCEALRTSKSMKSLRDWHASGSSVSDEFIAAKLAASTQLDSIVLNGSKFSENSFRSLVENHAKTIRKISLGACTTITSIQIQGILSHCFLLEEFDAYKINCIDLAKIDLSNKAFDPNNPTTYENIILGEDWVCVGLRNLELFFNMSVDDFGKELRSRKDRIIVQQQQHKLQERHAFRQLSRLTKLETLSFSTAAIWDSKNQKGLEMKLMSQGGELDQLESLRNIKSIDFTGTSQTMGIEDIDWMILHFPKLKFLRGSLHYDAFQDVELKAYFNKSSQLNS
ncbi:hypothetical protein BGZ76_011840 [Entomortierella beljakovae]|nr:hypothetical protein BGZ76_011840 [Entomortierella beljakovae]